MLFARLRVYVEEAIGSAGSRDELERDMSELSSLINVERCLDDI